MVGSTQSTSGPTFVLNTIVADVLAEIADELENCDDIGSTAQKILKKIATDHGRVIFNGDNYTDGWVLEAQKRGLSNIKSTVGSLATIMSKENIDVFERQNVLSKAELAARTEILFEAYSMQINIEAVTMLQIAKRQILPASIEYSGRLAATVSSIDSVGVSVAAPKAMLERVCGLVASLDGCVKKLEKATCLAAKEADYLKKAELYRDTVVKAMEDTRRVSDELETIVDAELWPLPTYAEMLFLR